MRNANQPKKISVLLLGPENTGKTALMRNLKGEEIQKEYVPTIGVDYRDREDNHHSVKVAFYDPSGSPRFGFIRKALMKEPKDCIIIVVNNLDAHESLHAIKQTLDEIDATYQALHNHTESYTTPPIALIINHTIVSDESVEKLLYAGIVEHFSFRFEFIDSFSVVDASYREIVFRQITRMGGIYISNAVPAETGSDLTSTFLSASTYISSFFWRPTTVAVPPKLIEEAKKEALQGDHTL